MPQFSTCAAFLNPLLKTRKTSPENPQPKMSENDWKTKNDQHGPKNAIFFYFFYWETFTSKRSNLPDGRKNEKQNEPEPDATGKSGTLCIKLVDLLVLFEWGQNVELVAHDFLLLVRDFRLHQLLQTILLCSWVILSFFDYLEGEEERGGNKSSFQSTHFHFSPGLILNFHEIKCSLSLSEIWGFDFFTNFETAHISKKTNKFKSKISRIGQRNQEGGTQSSWAQQPMLGLTYDT